MGITGNLYKIYRRDLYGKTSKRGVNYKANTMYI